MGLRGFMQTIGQADMVSSATALHGLGDWALDNQGRMFRYAKAGAVALVAGNVLQSPAWPVDQVNLAVPAAEAIGETTVVITNGATNAITLNQYAGGLAVVETTPGEGYSYRIVTNSAAATGGAITIVIEAPGLIVAWTTATKVSLHLNPFDGVIQSPVTTLTGMTVGVATYIIVAAQYGWIGCHGTFGTLCAGTPALGSMVTVPGTAAGAIVIHSGELMSVGIMRVTGVDTKIKAVFWTLG